MSGEAPAPLELLSPSHQLAGFASGRPPLDRWLVHSARTAAAAGTAATYVLQRGDRVVGHYALAIAAALNL